MLQDRPESFLALCKFAGRLMKIPIFYDHSPIMKRPNNPVIINGTSVALSLEHRRCIRKMLAVLAGRQNQDRTVVGISAPQLGYNYRLMAFLDISHRGGAVHVMANPSCEIPLSAKATAVQEGCLSDPLHRTSWVSRWDAIQLTATEIRGSCKMFRKNILVKGPTAAIIQHEIDHLEGRRWPPTSSTGAI